jgi:hypothetical protein
MAVVISLTRLLVLVSKCTPETEAVERRLKGHFSGHQHQHGFIPVYKLIILAQPFSLFGEGQLKFLGEALVHLALIVLQKLLSANFIWVISSQLCCRETLFYWQLDQVQILF